MDTPYFCPISVTTINLETHRAYQESDHLQAHEQIIRPLFNAATAAYVYRGTAKERRYPWGDIIDGSRPIELKEESILRPEKGKYVFDKAKECITGHEYLWNANRYRRGSIVLVLPNDFDFSGIFPYCYNVGVSATPNSGNSPGALKLCREVRSRNGIATIFLASNGIQYMDIHAADEAHKNILNLAESLCRDGSAYANEPLCICGGYTGNAQEMWQYQQVKRSINNIHNGIFDNMSLCATLSHEKAVSVVETLFSQIGQYDILLARFACLKLWEIPESWLVENLDEILDAAYAGMPKCRDHIVYAVAHLLEEEKRAHLPPMALHFHRNTIEHMKYLGVL